MARLEMRMYESEAAALASAAARVGARPTDLLRTIASRRYCGRECWDDFGAERCERVVVSDDVTYRILSYQIRALERNHSQCDSALARICRADVSPDADLALLDLADAQRHVGTLIDDLDDLAAMLARPLAGDWYTSSRSARIGMRIDAASKANLRAAAASVGTSMTDLLRALAAAEAEGIEACGGEVMPSRAAWVYLDVDVLNDAADEICCIGYAYNDLARGLHTAAAHCVRWQADKLASRLDGIAGRLRGVDDALNQVVGDMYRLLMWPAAKLRRIDHGGGA